MNARIGAVGVVMALVTGIGGCTPGYMKADDLNRKQQGPSFCAKRCEELGMRMAALVLVSNDLPGCVCQPVYQHKKRPVKSAPSEDEDAATEGSSAATTGYVVLAAAAAARQQQAAIAAQQSYSHK